MRGVLAADSENETGLGEVVALLRSHCDNLMRDYPMDELRNRRSAMLIWGKKADDSGHTIISCENIDDEAA